MKSEDCASLKYDEDVVDEVLVFRFAGCFSGRLLKDFKERYKELLSSSEKRMILDLKDVDIIDSSGLGFLVNSYVELKDLKKSFYIVGANPYLMRILGLIALPVEKDCKTALDKYRNEEH
jgi:anti-anti-sigma factor